MNSQYEILASVIQDICGEMDLAVRSYSGRSMYGQKCLGVELENSNPASFAFQLGLKLCNACDEDCENLEILYDSLGRGMIVYFPELSML